MDNKTKEQIELAESLIEYMEDYVVLAKANKKLKTQNVDKELGLVTDFIQNNVEDL